MSAREFSPRPYQVDAMAHLMDTPRCALFMGMGMGKTVATLSALDALALLEDVWPALVVAPLRVATSTWPQESQKWAHLQHLRVVPITGTAKERAAALATPADVYAINYENLEWLEAQLGGWAKFRTVVADESTRLKSWRGGFVQRKDGVTYLRRAGGKRSRALAGIALAARRFIALTGTPAANGLQDLWGAQWFIDHGKALGGSYTAFTGRWFTESPDGRKLRPYAHAQAEIQDRIRGVCLTIDAADHLDVQAPQVVEVPVTLPPAARRAYEAMAVDLFAELESGLIVDAKTAEVKSGKLLQMASGAIYTTAPAFEELHREKLAALDSIVEELAGAPLLVAYHWRHSAQRILAAFPQARMLDKSPATIDAWNRGEIPILLAHPASAGHGLNLQDGGHHLAFFEHWWSAEERDQVVERIGPVRQLQAGHPRPVWVYEITALDTLDGVVRAALERKTGVQAALLDAMKKRKSA